VAWDKQMNKALSLFPAHIILPLMQVAWTLLCVLTGCAPAQRCSARTQRMCLCIARALTRLTSSCRGIFFGEFATLHGANAGLFALGIGIMLAGVAFLVPPRDTAAEAGAGAPADDGQPGTPKGVADAAQATAAAERDTARMLPPDAGGPAAAPGAAAPPLPPRPLTAITTRGSLLRSEAAAAAVVAAATPRSNAANMAAFDAVSFSLFSVPTLKEVAADAEAGGHALPAYLRLERSLANAGDMLEDAADKLIAQAEASVTQLRPRRAEQAAPPPLPPKPPPPLPPKPPAADAAAVSGTAVGAAALERNSSLERTSSLERSGSLTRRTEPQRESVGFLHSISFGGSRISEGTAAPEDIP
jgi:hypothetical protein